MTTNDSALALYASSLPAAFDSLQPALEVERQDPLRAALYVNPVITLLGFGLAAFFQHLVH